MAFSDEYTTLPLDLPKIPWVPVNFRSKVEERVHYLTTRQNHAESDLEKNYWESRKRTAWLDVIRKEEGRDDT